MPLEVWIVLALIVAGGIAAAVFRLRRKRKAEAPASESNAYPLW